MRPIAKKILAAVKRARSRDLVDLSLLREARALVAEPLPDSSELPPAHAAWMAAFAELARFATPMFGLKELHKLSERVENLEEAYMPGGPPMSPLTESFFTTWSLLDAAVGIKRETLATIAVDLGRAVGAPRELLAMQQTLADSYSGFYRITARDGLRVELEELVTSQRAAVELADDVEGEPGWLWWTRLLPPPSAGAAWASFTTPYVLPEPGAASAWLDYFDRALADAAGERTAAYRRLMKRRPDPAHGWFEFILDAYAGELRCAVALAGVPDRPASLPCSEQGQEERERAMTPLERLRVRLYRAARACGLDELSAEDFALAREDLAVDDEVDRLPSETILQTAYTMLGAVDERGRTPLDLVAADPELPADEKRELEAIRAGWFSVFEVRRIKIDEGLELFDVLRRRRIWVTERLATRDLGLGDVLAGWLTVDGEVTRLEGGMALVPSVRGPAFVATAKNLAKAMGRRHGGWKARNAAMVPWVGAAYAKIFSQPLALDIRNHDDDALIWAEATYAIADRARVIAALSSHPALDGTGDGCFRWHDPARDLSLGAVECSERSVVATANSRERLSALRSLVETAAGDAVVHRADSFSDPTSAAQTPRAERSAVDSSEIPDDARAALTAMLEGKLKAWLDEPVPMLGDKTPRQAIRSETGQDAVSALLMQQERALRRGKAADDVDFGRAWRELGLDYPGPFAP